MKVNGQMEYLMEKVLYFFGKILRLKEYKETLKMDY